MDGATCSGDHEQSQTDHGGARLRSGDVRPAIPVSHGEPGPCASSAATPSSPWPTGHDVPRLATANAGDHKLVHTLLRAVHQNPSYEDFATWLDDPRYDPADRLLAKQGDKIIAHVHVLHRVGWFGGVQVPMGSVQDLAALPEYRRAGYEHLLLGAGPADNGRRPGDRLARPDPLPRAAPRLRLDGRRNAGLHTRQRGRHPRPPFGPERAMAVPPQPRPHPPLATGGTG